MLKLLNAFNSLFNLDVPLNATCMTFIKKQLTLQ